MISHKWLFVFFLCSALQLATVAQSTQVATPTPTNKAKADEALARGKRLFDEKKYDAAFVEFTDVFEMEEDFAKLIDQAVAGDNDTMKVSEV